MEKPDKPKKATKAKPVKKPGKAKSEASAGATAAKPKAGAKSAGAGKAAAKSYAAEVKKKINRTRRKPVSARGSATVAFTISPSGGIGSIAITKSSGNAAVDHAAVDHVKRTAPFPPPPEGAGRTFSYTHTSK
ncbi:MAG: TonB C-terminal domain-containing protein [Rhodobacteraceae bacterium]|nr:TonB C-terminal domain-containing protein [Paracoccaceae bacterium]